MSDINDAIRMMDMERLKIILAEGNIDPNYSPYGHELPIIVSAEKSTCGTMITELLIKHGARWTVSDVHGETVFHAAARTGNYLFFQYAMKTFQKYDIENLMKKKDEKGFTMLAIAVQQRDSVFVQFLLNKTPVEVDSSAVSSALLISDNELAQIFIEKDAPWEEFREREGTVLHIAARTGNIAFIYYLLDFTNYRRRSSEEYKEQYKDFFNQKNRYVPTALTVAIKNRQWELVDLLIEMDIIIPVESDVVSSLMEDETRIALKLLRPNLEIRSEWIDYEKKTALFIAASLGNIEFIKGLFAFLKIETREKSAMEHWNSYLNFTDFYPINYTALGISINEKQWNVVDLLLDYITPYPMDLRKAIEHSNFLLAKRLILRGDISLDREEIIIGAAENGDIDFMTFLLELSTISDSDKNRLFNQLDHLQRSALTVAIDKKNNELISLLLDSKIISPRLTDILSTCDQANYDVVTRILLSDVKWRTMLIGPDSETIIVTAAENGTIKFMRFFLQYMTEEKRKYTPTTQNKYLLQRAMRNENVDMVNVLLELSDIIPTLIDLHAAIRTNRIELVRMIKDIGNLDFNLLVDYHFEFSGNALHSACVKGSVEMVEYILKDIKNPNERSPRLPGRITKLTALLIAINFQTKGAFQALLRDDRVDINIGDGELTPLSLAIVNEHYDFAMKLINHPRIIVDYIDEVTPKEFSYTARITALFYAARHVRAPFTEILRRMLELGANVFHRDSDGNLPIDYAPKDIFGDDTRDSLYHSMRDPLFPCMQCRTLFRRSDLYGPRSYYRCLKCLRDSQMITARGFTTTEREPGKPLPFLPFEVAEMILVYHIENIKANQEREIQYEIDHGLLLSPTSTEMRPLR